MMKMKRRKHLERAENMTDDNWLEDIKVLVYFAKHGTNFTESLPKLETGEMNSWKTFGLPRAQSGVDA